MLRLITAVYIILLGSALSYANDNGDSSNEILEYRHEKFRAYLSILNRFSLQGFEPFNQNSYVWNSSLILEGHQKWWWKANVFFMLQTRVTFILNKPSIPVKNSFGFLLGLSGFVYNNISLSSGGKGTSVLMFGGVYFSPGDWELSGNYGIAGPEIGIRINTQFHKNAALTFGFDIGYHHKTYRIKPEPTDDIRFPAEIFTNYHGFMIGASIGFTFNSNYISAKNLQYWNDKQEISEVFNSGGKECYA